MSADPEKLDQSPRESSHAEKEPSDLSTAPPTVGKDEVEGKGSSASAQKAAAEPDSAQAWLVALGGFLGLSLTFGQTNGLGAYIQYYQTVAYPDADASILGLIGGVQAGTLFFIGPVVGRAFDLYGPRPILLLGTFSMTLGLMMLSLTNALWQVFLTQGILLGIGIGCFFVTSVSLIPHWFVKRRSFAIGIITSGGSAGGLCFAPAVKRLIDEVGAPWMNRILGFITLAVLLVAVVLLRARVPPNPANARSLMPKWDLLKKREYAFLWLTTLTGYLSIFGVFFFISSRGLSVGMSADLATYLVCILNAGSIIGRLLPNFLGDRLGPLNMLVIATGLQALFLAAAWIPATTEGGVIVTALLYGFSSGSWVSITPACVPRCAGGIQYIGAAMGLIYLAAVPGALAGASIGSALIGDVTQQSGYQKAGAVWASFCAVSLVCAVTTRYLVAGTLRPFVKA